MLPSSPLPTQVDPSLSLRCVGQRTIDGWNCYEDAVINEYFVRLTPDRQSKTGACWSTRSINSDSWVTTIKFRISGQVSCIHSVDDPRERVCSEMDSPCSLRMWRRTCRYFRISSLMNVGKDVGRERPVQGLRRGLFNVPQHGGTYSIFLQASSLATTAISLCTLATAPLLPSSRTRSTQAAIRSTATTRSVRTSPYLLFSPHTQRWTITQW